MVKDISYVDTDMVKDLDVKYKIQLNSLYGKYGRGVIKEKDIKMSNVPYCKGGERSMEQPFYDIKGKPTYNVEIETEDEHGVRMIEQLEGLTLSDYEVFYNTIKAKIVYISLILSQ